MLKQLQRVLENRLLNFVSVIKDRKCYLLSTQLRSTKKNNLFSTDVLTIDFLDENYLSEILNVEQF
jgi:hypothetical protein